MTEIFRELNTYRATQFTLKRDDVAIDLTTADHVSISVRLVNGGTVLVDHEAMTIVNPPTDGVVSYQFTETELGAGSAGSYELQVEIFWPGGKSEDVTIVSNELTVKDHFGTHA